MEHERKILATALNNADHCGVLKALVDIKLLSPEAAVVFEFICDYYDTDPEATSVDRELLCAAFERSIASEKVRRMLVLMVKELPSDTSAANVIKQAREFKAHVIGQQLSNLLSTNGDPSNVDRLMGEYQSLRDGEEFGAESGEEEYRGVGITGLTATSFSKEGLIEVWPPVLNDHIDGGARRGHHILVFAPVEMGKTLVAVNMTAGFLKQGLRVLYIGNEDPPADILMRLATRLSGRTKHEIIADPIGTDAILERRNWSHFTMVSMAPGTFDRINYLVRRDPCDVVILDQLRNFDVKSGNRTEALEAAATAARNIAKRHNVLVVSVTQAADSASGKRMLTRGDVDSSNVGIPGQVDLMIGIGADATMEATNMRSLSFPKNKLSGRHEPLTVEIDPSTSRILV